MAAFCKQCSIDLFGEDFGDHKGLVSEEHVKDGYMMPVICEGCGIVGVDHEGKCVDRECEIHANPPEMQSQIPD